jgi:hypothetical protein
LFEADQYNGLEGYVVSDLNGDGAVNIFDYPIFEANQYNGIELSRP